jgi:hypothetical protein
MRIYWLHIIEHKSPQSGAPSTYTLARADAPELNVTSGELPTVHHHSWERLSARFVLRRNVLLSSKVSK